MHRTTHLLARSAIGAAWLWSRRVVGVQGKRSAGNPARI